MNGVTIDLAVIVVTILLLVSLANRLGVAYPIFLVLGGIALGYIPQLPELAMPPNLVLVIFLPPLLYWESLTAPTSELFTGSGLWWLFQLAFGLVLATMFAVGVVAHALIPNMTLAAAFVLGAIVASTDEVAFAPIVERVGIPRHVLATIEGESLVNDATSLVLYGLAVGVVASGTFSLTQAAGALLLSVVGALAVGVLAALVAVLCWHLTKDDALQAVVSLMTPYLAYLSATRIGASGVLAVVAAGLTVTRFTPRVLTPRARERVGGFWVTIVFMLNALIFVLVGMQFHHIVSVLGPIPAWRLALYAIAVSVTVIAVRMAWVFGQGLLPSTNEPEHEEGKADWSHVAVLAWSGMRGGVSLAAALAIPLQTAAGPFPHRNLIIFLTFCVLIATLIGQGGTLPWLLRGLGVQSDGTDEREARAALAKTARTALSELRKAAERTDIPEPVIRMLRERFAGRWRGFSGTDRNAPAAQHSDKYRHLAAELLDAQRDTLLDMRRRGEVDNTVFRKIQRLLDLEAEEIDLLESTGHPEIEGAD